MKNSAVASIVAFACGAFLSCSGGSGGGDGGNPVHPTPPSEPPPGQSTSATWKAQSIGTDRDVLHVQFFDETNGVAVGRGADPEFLRTSDGGATWASEIVSGGMVNDMGTLFGFLDPTTGLIGGQACNVARTTDGGATWRLMSICLSVRWVLELDYADATNWWVGGGGGILLKSTDAGDTWTRVEIEGLGIPVGSIAFLDADMGMVAASRSIYRTTDGGETWEEHTQDVLSSLHDLAFLDDQIGVATGEDGIVMRTTDGGESWTRVRFGGPNVGNVDFGEDGFAVAVGQGGTILVSNDRGATWTEERSGTRVDLTDVTVLDRDHVWVSGLSGTILVREP